MQRLRLLVVSDETGHNPQVVVQAADAGLIIHILADGHALVVKGAGQGVVAFHGRHGAGVVKGLPDARLVPQRFEAAPSPLQPVERLVIPALLSAELP